MTASPPLDLTGFGSWPSIGPADTLNSVTATVNGWNSDPGMGPLSYELRDSHGTLIGSATGTASTSPAHVDVVVFSPPSWSELHWMHLRVAANAGTAPSGAFASVDYASLSVSYVSAGLPFAAPVLLAAATAIARAPDATGPRGRFQVDITVAAGPTLSRSQVPLAGMSVSRSQVAAAGPTSDDGKGAGSVSVRAPIGA